MTSTSADASTPTTPRFTTSTTPFRIPRFTPASGCVNASNIVYETDSCSWGTGIGLYKPDTHTCTFFGIRNRDKDCLPGYRNPATECPVQYTAVNTWEGEQGNDETSYEVKCCPTVYDFKWRGMATLTDDRGSSASLTISSCVARRPSFAGEPPWDLNISYWSTSGQDTINAVTTAEFDPDTDVLVASAATISYVVNKHGSTCVPDCETPYTGQKWPPQVTQPSSTPSPDDSGLGGLATFLWALLGTVCGVALLCFGCCFWVCRRRRKRRKVMAQGQASQTLDEDQALEGEGSDQGGIRMGKVTVVGTTN